ncbi:MAG: ABC transporter ATP-binding protein [Oscillospiraceae bacterium]|nr:ABC transporter ATP-binding protein [Oscillospiraceae bacterium]
MLRVENLQVNYGDFRAVSSASIAVRKGETASVLGTNGSGKTSLLQAVAGLITPAGGRVLFEEEEITGLPAEQVVERGLSLVPQGGKCFPRMSVYDNLMVGSYPKHARPHAQKSLERVFGLFPVLQEKRRDPAGTLSGGQRQMLAIGRAMMAAPKCLMFDEISLGLAPVAIGELYACIRRIHQEENITVLMVEQNTERALRISDVSFVMRKGEIVLSGPASGLSSAEIRAAYFGI